MEARKEKNWALADKIRRALASYSAHAGSHFLHKHFANSNEDDNP